MGTHMYMDKSPPRQLWNVLAPTPSNRQPKPFADSPDERGRAAPSKPPDESLESPEYGVELDLSSTLRGAGFRPKG